MLLNIRGTHGSGKSTIVKSLIERYPSTELFGENPRRPDGYRVDVPWLGRPVMVIGSYRTACGGCDGIQPYSLIWPRIVAYSAEGHVLFEGALVSSSYGNIGRASEAFGDDAVFAFMDTPLDVCLDRIRRRRAAKGKTEPLNPKNTADKHRNVETSLAAFRAAGRRIEFLDHRNPNPRVAALLVEGDRRPLPAKTR